MKAIKLFLILAIIYSGYNPAFSISDPHPDSSRYKWVNGEKYLLHKVHSKDTWNSISRKYNMPVSDLLQANPGVVDLRAGQIINVPSEKNFTAMTQKEAPAPAVAESKDKAPVYYTVNASETLYSIAKKNNSTVEQIKDWNGLLNDQLKPGQKLIVSYGSANAKPEDKADNTAKQPDKINESTTDKKMEAANTSANEVKSEPVAVKNEAPVKNSGNTAIEKKADPIKVHTSNQIGKGGAGTTVSQVSEKGICSWITDDDINQNKYYALHRTAPIGTLMKVTNKMNDRYVYVKVVGVLPDTGDNENSIIKISQAAVNKLGALDAHFLVELSYGLLQ
jgi:LysM repeat protein